MQWHRSANTRLLPWKGITNPYYIWLSEIILQQTRVAQGLDYYERFIHQFPSISDLALASEEKVLKAWEGLGYYSRARNLHATARYVWTERGGVFPNSYEEILKLKGIGPYTAAAISSFAFGEKRAVVDGNVQRILTRYLGIYTPADSRAGKKEIDHIAQKLIDVDHPALYNQAIMDLGATICKPQKPDCIECPLQKDCFAYQQNKITVFPVKNKKTLVKDRYILFLIFHRNDRMALQQRCENDVWKNLFAFPAIESAEPITEKHLRVLLKAYKISPRDILDSSDEKTWILTHRRIKSLFLDLTYKSVYAHFTAEAEWLSETEILNKALPRLIQKFLADRIVTRD